MYEHLRLSGRLNRKSFWLRTLVIYVAVFGIYAVLSFIAKLGSVGDDIPEFAKSAIIVVAIAALMLPPQVRRLHDRNKSGWWFIFLFVVPIIVEAATAATGDPLLTNLGAMSSFIISVWYLVEIGFMKGTDGPNRYGPDPLKGGIDAEVFD